jgi:hypothetical protein
MLHDHAQSALDMLDRAHGAKALGSEALVMATLGVGYALLQVVDEIRRAADICGGFLAAIADIERAGVDPAEAAAADAAARTRVVVDDREIAPPAGVVEPADEPARAFDRVDLVELVERTHRTHHVQLPPDTPGAGAAEWRDCPLPHCVRARELYDELPMRP